MSRTLHFGHPAVRAVDAIGEGLARAGRGVPRVDRALYTLSEAGNHSAIWHGINLVDATVGAALTGARGGDGSRRRRNAVRRSAVLLTEQVVVNGIVKSRFRRLRPTTVDDHPHDLRTPRTSSFPSGHASAGACSATMLSADLGAAPVWWLLAAGVAWSRVHVGAHHASDVLGGITIGRIVGQVAVAIWPGRR
ncbi:MAG: phosphatase PAP2 family protein [Microthrixaceae bacterium]|jgi:undecaprenyl-diphosphatase